MRAVLTYNGRAVYPDGYTNPIRWDNWAEALGFGRDLAAYRDWLLKNHPNRTLRVHYVEDHSYMEFWVKVTELGLGYVSDTKTRVVFNR